MEISKIAEESGKLVELEDDNAIAKHLSDVLIPLVDSSIEKMKDIHPQTEEVKNLKKQYAKVFDAYKKGFEALLEGCETQDEATINSATESINEGIKLLDEYNTALEKLAEEHGAEIEY